MTFFHTIILGIVEGITEFLPISSTAHLSIVGALLRIPDTDFQKVLILLSNLAQSVQSCVSIYKRFLFQNIMEKSSSSFTASAWYWIHALRTNKNFSHRKYCSYGGYAYSWWNTYDCS